MWFDHVNKTLYREHVWNDTLVKGCQFQYIISK